MTLVSAFIMVCAVSVTAYGGSALQDEYLAAADRLRVRAGVETDSDKKAEYIRQAEKYELMADKSDSIESDSIFDDENNEFDQENAEEDGSVGQDRFTREEKIRRDYERSRKVQEEVEKLTCASCRDIGSGGGLGGN
ncbi:MAG: hypothetical protein A3J24_09975 [Deltaproteobacteria bacterium RIFCSPLOWO2_02_FULL_53_8]|nr:MAG: hypothetical protein A3J24_09975 [Deltaproteobacteria bacterium RIFCSPLOWO2_02_FULL_53_8]